MIRRTTIKRLKKSNNGSMHVARVAHASGSGSRSRTRPRSGSGEGSGRARGHRANNYPSVFFGNIASANQVMRHGLTWDRIAREHNVLCFEMKAAGLMDQFPCLAIRGILDYADSHKDDRWQDYASAVAAAFAKDLLLVTPVRAVGGEFPR
ncbi:hypothetical protein F9C07_10607 [Aspergillus flavus]|uniref:Nucleoside phosphorylase domain-containing protein n=1 Tax=Aspergillus flavus (strain ATCC 200026 / FGSC A1120 / IAM 13836 / NRRL 3357 / JCM 12722 / SRRC 167) TaxID=332952 RepID=A0A7U2MVB3_ASPFN|nr:hypothetical protein F9C07_10607 [Aspergillus flavus]